MRTLLMDAIRGVGFPTMELGDSCERSGLARFTGNQHNASWAWNEEKLEEMTEEQLQELYTFMRTEREKIYEALRSRAKKGQGSHAN